jgi:hypothetical protein
MTSANPWRAGDLNDLIVKFTDLGAPHTVKTLQIIREIDDCLTAIENEDRRRLAAKKASENFKKGIIHAQQH